ncbi:MAG: DUF3352 domain-containing protein, partial [Burkholderiales bacterium]|nr:DUF3352 domain-containing protein [Anaerolineae bacterium]
DYETNILPWVGHRIGVTGEADMSTPGEYALIMPVDPGSSAGALADFESLIASTWGEGTSLSSIQGVTVYTSGTASVAFASNVGVVIAGPEAIVSGALGIVRGEPSLASDAAFMRIRAALPLDSAWAHAYFSGEFLAEQIGPQGVAGAQEFERFLFESTPSQSEIETALLEVDWIEGVGFAIELEDEELTFSGAVTVDAQYTAPSHASELLPYIPDKAFYVLDSRNLGEIGLSGAALFTLILGPSVDSVFNNIVASLEQAATPTPVPMPSFDDNVAQARMMFSMVAAQFGMTVDEFVDAFSGEFAVTVFPAEGMAFDSVPGLGGAAFMQSDNPDEIITALDTLLPNLNEFGAGTASLERHEESIDGVDVVIWSDNDSDLLGYGALDGSVVFLATGNALSIAIAGRSEQAPAINIEGDAFVYFNVSGYIAAMTNTPMGADGFTPFMEIAEVSSQFDAADATFDIQDDGVFVGRVTFYLAEGA